MLQCVQTYPNAWNVHPIYRKKWRVDTKTGTAYRALRILNPINSLGVDTKVRERSSLVSCIAARCGSLLLFV
jgi:hypothetical protein